MKLATFSVLLVTCVSMNAYAERVECDDPIENKAIVGFPPGDDVVFYEDPDQKACRFSVNGWSAGSPPQEVLLSARNQIRETMAAVVASKGQQEPSLADAIAVYLAAASPLDNGDPKLGQSSYPQAINDCLASYPDPDGRSFVPYQSFDFEVEGFWCSIVDPRQGEPLGQLNDFLAQGVDQGVRVVELTTPYAVFRNERDGGREFLFLALPTF